MAEISTAARVEAKRAEVKRAAEAKPSARTAKRERVRPDATANRRACQGTGENALPFVATVKNASPECANALPARAKAAATAICVAPVLTTARVARAELRALPARRDNRAKQAHVMGVMTCPAPVDVAAARPATHLRLQCAAEHKAKCARPATRTWQINASTANARAEIPGPARRGSDARPESVNVMRRAVPTVAVRETNAKLLRR